LLKNTECKEHAQYNEKFQGKLCFQGKRKLRKILNNKNYFNTVKISVQHCFSGKAQVAQKY